MKNHNLIRFGKVLMLLPCLVFLVNCSKSSKDSNNNQCYQNQYGSTYYNPNCNSGNGGYGQSQQCQGTYFYQGQPVTCEYPQQCSGWTLQMNSNGPQGAPGTPGQSVRCI